VLEDLAALQHRGLAYQTLLQDGSLSTMCPIPITRVTFVR
jgi:hypothetical protein